MAMQCDDDEYERYLCECVETGQYDEGNFADPLHLSGGCKGTDTRETDPGTRPRR